MNGEMKVGALARATGLTVRTLHHYDEIGLLRPSGRTSSGHRLYGVQEVRRLQRITSLRQLGLPLDEIRRCLEHPGYGLAEVLEMQRERLERQIDRQTALLDRISRLIERVRSSDDPHIDELTGAIRMTTEYEKYYTPEQMEQLESRARTIGPERIQQVQKEWRQLFAAFGRAMEDGLDPAAPEVQILCGRYDALIEEFTGGDAGIMSSLSEMYRQEGGPQVMERNGMDMPPGLWDYIGRAKGSAHP